MLKFEAKKGDFAKIWQKLGGLQPPSPAAHASILLRSAKERLLFSEDQKRIKE